VPQHPFTYRNFIARFDSDEACREHILKVLWKGKLYCPDCGSEKYYKETSRPSYKCANNQCYRIFRVTTGTIFEGSKIPLRDWFYTIKILSCYKKGVSSIELSKELGISQKSAWYMLHKIRSMHGNVTTQKFLSGIVEVDETYIGGKKKGGKRGRGTEKVKVFGMLERSGLIRMIKVPDCSSKTLHPLIFENVQIGTVIMSDEWKAYNGLHKYYERGVINHGNRHYADGEIHVNTLEGAWGLLKRNLKGIYHRQSDQHMEKYCAEFVFRYDNRKKSVPLLFKQAIKQSGIRVMHKDITPAKKKK